MLASARPFKHQTAEQHGTGLIGTLFGTTVFLLFLLFAVQVLIGLYTTTVVSAAALDAATSLSHQDNPADATTQNVTEAEARTKLGRFGSDPGRLRFDWTGTSSDTVVVTVHAHKMTLLPAPFGAHLGNRIDRTYRVRVEAVR